MKEPRPSIKWLVPPRFDETGVQVSSGIAVDGREFPDPVPMAPPIGYEAPTQLEQLIEQVVRRRDFNARMEAMGAETFEEADDFDVDEDYDPRFEETIYEAYFEAKSKRAAVLAEARQAAAASRKASADLDAALSKASSVEMQKSSSVVSTNSSVDSPSTSEVDPKLSSPSDRSGRT